MTVRDRGVAWLVAAGGSNERPPLRAADLSEVPRHSAAGSRGRCGLPRCGQRRLARLVEAEQVLRRPETRSTTLAHHRGPPADSGEAGVSPEDAGGLLHDDASQSALVAQPLRQAAHARRLTGAPPSYRPGEGVRIERRHRRQGAGNVPLVRASGCRTSWTMPSSRSGRAGVERTRRTALPPTDDHDRAWTARPRHPRHLIDAHHLRRGGTGVAARIPRREIPPPPPSAQALRRIRPSPVDP